MKRGFLAGVLVTLLVMCLVSTAGATSGKVQQEIEYRDIKVSLDGQVLDLRDAKGNTVEPFMFGGTNYIPARALALHRHRGADAPGSCQNHLHHQQRQTLSYRPALQRRYLLGRAD